MHALTRLLAATAVVCGVATQVWAQAAAPATPQVPHLALSAVPVDSVTAHPTWPGRGVYAFFASPAARERLRAAGLSVADDGLVYVGRTLNSFRERLSHHITGTSNLGRSLRSVLSYCASGWRCPVATPTDVSRFMRAHFRVAMLPLDDAAMINASEGRLIRASSPPLNLAGVSNANSRRLDHLRKRLAGRVPSIAAIPTMVKGAGIGALVELPVTAVVESLHVRNGTKTPEEAVVDGAKAVGTVALGGAALGGMWSGAAVAGITIPPPVLVPLAVAGSLYYLSTSTKRVWDALDEDTRAEVEERVAAAAGELGRRLDADARELDLHLREQFGELRGRVNLEGLRDAIAGIWPFASGDQVAPLGRPDAQLAIDDLP